MRVTPCRLLALVVAAMLALPPVAALGRGPRPGPLSGRWSGYIGGQYGSRAGRRHIIIVVNARETGGSWWISAACHGPLSLESISDGYHHFLRKLARGSRCGGGGDVDCLKRAGRNVYDAVTSHLGGAWDSSGTLRRVRSRRR